MGTGDSGLLHLSRIRIHAPVLVVTRLAASRSPAKGVPLHGLPVVTALPVAAVTAAHPVRSRANAVSLLQPSVDAAAVALDARALVGPQPSRRAVAALLIRVIPVRRALGDS